MLKIKFFLTLIVVFAISLTFISCEEEDDSIDQEEEQVEVNQTSIIPSSTAGRPNNYLGCVTISSRITTIEVWDHGAIDGDIVSIYANGITLIDQIELDGPGNPISRNYDFGYNGFNYVTLFAHNLGDISPNTCTVSINGSEFILEANLEANGAIDVIVGGYGVDCSDSSGDGGSGSGGSGNGGNDPSPGKIKFWTQQDFGCGIITVTVSGAGSASINGFFSGGPGDCDNTSGGGNFSNLAPGDYSFTASCSDRSWNGTVNVSDGGCTLFQLL